MMRSFLIFLGVFIFLQELNAQDPVPLPGGRRMNIPNASSSSSRKDTIGFERRDDSKDSITLTYRFLDSLRRIPLDSSINDFDKYFSVPSDYQYLGNNGAAAFPLVFRPFLKAGFDPGFHAFDIYRLTIDDTKIYRTTRPFSMLGYQLASGKEQMIKVLHTQNPRPNISAGFNYRLINAPGFFVTQNTNHNNYRLYGNYTGKRKRYSGTLVAVGNTFKASQNGGITNDSFLLDPNKKERFSIPVNLGNAAAYQPNPFSTVVSTGSLYRDFNFLLRQSYDLGKTDSIAINDSTTEYLFYPRLRLQHTLTYTTYNYLFRDESADSILYKRWYNVTLRDSTDSFSVREKWSVLGNDFSLVQFPDTKNASQFFLAGITLQNLKKDNDTLTNDSHNIFLHAEYRNRTRNKLWDMLLKGEYYLNGINGGDYSVHASLSRYLNPKWGYIQFYFTNVNRTPSFIFDNRSGFRLEDIHPAYNKENITSFGATATNPFIKLGFANHLITNYSYFSNFYQTTQSSKVQNVLQVFASKKIALTKRINWYIDAVAQQTDPNGPIKIPLLFTRNRLAYEGRFFRNLNLSTGLDIRYYTPYEAYNFSPVNGQFVPQDTLTIKNLPDIHAFLHFRIKGFTGFLRAENLNTASFRNGFGFINNNFAAPSYPTQGLMIRFGIQWWFVN